MTTDHHKKVFLGGTCNGSHWREALRPLLHMDVYDPQADDWTEDQYEEELKQRTQCDFLLYVITPKMEGVYSIAEVVEDSHAYPSRVYVCFLQEDEGRMFTAAQEKSLQAVARLLQWHGVTCYHTLPEVAAALNRALEG